MTSDVAGDLRRGPIRFATRQMEGVPAGGTVEIVKENGAWKMTGAVEQWKPKVD